MATTPSSSASRPATADRDAAFKKFDDYPWVRDRAFLQGLVAMLGPLSNSFERQKALGVTLQARIWWYQSRLGIDVDRTAYEDYTSSRQPQISANSSIAASALDSALLDKVEDIQQRLGLVAPGGSAPPEASSTSTSTSNLPAWMVEAPQKVDLNKKADDGVSHGGEGGGGQDAPYPAHFQAIIEAVTMGKPVPGVREIPNTVVRQAGILPVGKMQAPRKPWERQQQAAPGGDLSLGAIGGNGNLLDHEFPPVEDLPQ